MARNQTFDEKIKRERNEIEKKKQGQKEGGREEGKGWRGRGVQCGRMGLVRRRVWNEPV